MNQEAVRLQRAVLDELEWEPSINAAEIGVAVKDGVVTLTGSVATYAQKLATEKAVKRVRGVRAVAEEIEVKIPSTLRRTDAEVAQAALDALEWDVEVPTKLLKVKVENGWLTLEGEVEWSFQRDAAFRAVRYLMGVRGVTNLIAVRPKVKVAEIKSKIGEAFKRSAELDANRIRVEAIGSKVTLTGNVHSWEEKDEANRVAWAAPGVAKVENLITVAP